MNAERIIKPTSQVRYAARSATDHAGRWRARSAKVGRGTGAIANFRDRERVGAEAEANRSPVDAMAAAFVTDPCST